jgi:hypothetical protein
VIRHLLPLGTCALVACGLVSGLDNLHVANVADGGQPFDAPPVADSPAGDAPVGADGNASGGDANGSDAPVASCGAEPSVCCGQTPCSPPKTCCIDLGSGNGRCVPPGGSCLQTSFPCDDTADCGGLPAVCCAALNANGSVATVSCKSTATECVSSGGIELLCNPAANPACPDGRTCAASTKVPGYSSCK